MEHYIVECRTGEQLDKVVQVVTNGEQGCNEWNGFILVPDTVGNVWKHFSDKPSAVKHCHEYCYRTPTIFQYDRWYKSHVKDKLVSEIKEIKSNKFDEILLEFNKSLVKDFMVSRFADMFNTQCIDEAVDEYCELHVFDADNIIKFVNKILSFK